MRRSVNGYFMYNAREVSIIVVIQDVKFNEDGLFIRREAR